MDKKKFFERYKPIFGTSTFKETYNAWMLLSEEQRTELSKKLNSQDRPKQELTTTFVTKFEEILKVKKGHYIQFNCSKCGKVSTFVKKCGKERIEGYKLMMCTSCRTDYTFRLRHNGLSRSEWQTQRLLGVKQSEETKRKISETNKKYYEDPKNREKTSKCLKEYYAENPKSKESIDKQRRSLIKTYQEHPEIIEQIRASCSEYNDLHKEELRQKTIEGMARYFQTDAGKKNMENFIQMSSSFCKSAYEDELFNFIKNLNVGETIHNDRNTLSKWKELDIFVPSLNYAIEYNGNYWHSSAIDDEENCKEKHLLKTKECESKNIKLFHIFEDDYINYPNEVKNIIKSHLKVDTTYINFDQLTLIETPLKDVSFFVKSQGLYKGEFQNYKCYYYNNLIQFTILQCGNYYRLINRANVCILNLPKLDKLLIWDRRLYFPTQKIVEYTNPTRYYTHSISRQLSEIPNCKNYYIFDCGDVITEN